MMSLSFFFWLIKLVRFIQPLVKMVFGESITEKVYVGKDFVKWSDVI